MKIRGITAFLMMFLLAVPAAFAADGAAIIKSGKCGDCHKMTGPAADTIAKVKTRKAPDLFYAGSKFNKDWLVGFLQNPTVIRPGGTVYINHIKTTGDKDDAVNVPKCASKLSAGDAAAAADHLMTLKDSKMKTGTAKIGEFSNARAKMLIIKTEACNSCHQIGGNGGISCPTWDGIGKRLNPDWVYAFMKDPQYWDPKIWMAKRTLDEDATQLIVNFIAAQK